ncbi:RNB domain-containing ribonuclease [Paraburkholderia sp. A3RO-2L]|uniref:RNB domain-containing ribonuclease n=1 Tax=unclassified Paraburkholderia TaxID=2615204 RepID=UPI003DA8963D
MRRRKISSDAAFDDILQSVDTRKSFADPAPSHQPAVTVFGTVSLNPRGFGFIAGSDGQDYFLRASLARFTLTGDTVQFVPSEPDPQAPRESREVQEIVSVSRDASRLLCELRSVDGQLVLVPDEPCFLPLQMTHGYQGAAAGDVVAVMVPAYAGAPTATPIAVDLVESLGPRSREGFDLDYALVRFAFDEPMPSLELPAAGVESAEAWRDVSRIPFVTIDGESTRDFDDAVFGRALPTGGWEVQVAIADVSWYVHEGSELDAWSAKRCTSLYLPGKTFPMLPESLSTDQCSLVPGQLRRAVVLVLELSPSGEVLNWRLERTWIESAARLTYSQVAAFMVGKDDVRFALPVERSLQALLDVYRVLSEQRQTAGRLDFDDPEPSLVQKEDGSWVLKWETRNDAHKLVEELMLLANRTAATMLVERYGAGLFRYQPPPDEQSWGELKNWALAREYALPKTPSLRSMADLVAAQPNADGQAAAALKVRSAMSPAKYGVLRSDEQGGHFSLSVLWYTHFTSPIRRYADLLVHRLLLAPAEYQPTAGDWEQLAQKVARCSERAQAARLAERMVWDRLKLQSLLAGTTPQTVVLARIARATARGLRVVFGTWQCGAWLPKEALYAHGYQWVQDTWVKTAGADAQLLQEGSQIAVSWTSLSMARPAYPELQVTLKQA